MVTPSSGQRERTSEAVRTNQSFHSASDREGNSDTSGIEVMSEHPASTPWASSHARASAQ